MKACKQGDLAADRDVVCNFYKVDMDRERLTHSASNIRSELSASENR